VSNLGDGFGKLFGGGDASFREQLSALKKEYGTVTAMARGLGVDRRTIQRWESGKIRQPKAAHTEGVGRTYRETRVRNRSVPNDGNVTVSFSQAKKGGGTRQRTVTGYRLDLEPGTMDHVRRAYVAHGKEGAAAAFVAGIGDSWYHEVFDDSLTGEGDAVDDTVSDPTPTGVSVR
jgi:hypothetical protein